MALSKIIIGATIACASFASVAHSYNKGDMVVRAGISGLHLDDSGEIRQNDAAVNNSRIDLRKDVVLGLNLAYFIRDNIGVELGLDNDWNIDMVGESYNVNNIGSFKIFLPTLTINYFPEFGNVTWAKPYVGFGASYARFTDERLSNAFTAFAAEVGTPKMDEDWGWVIKFGIDLPVQKHLLLNAAVNYHQLNSSWNVRHTNTHYTADFKLHSYQWLLGVGYQF